MYKALMACLICLTIISCKPEIVNPVNNPKAPIITTFLPTSGTEGTEVTITGSNFNPDKSKNIVKFNGTTAVVTEATASMLEVIVPAGATTGKLSISVETKTATSTSNFTVTGQSLTITNVTPDRSEGGTVTINGTGFINTGGNLVVRFGNLDATIQPASTTTQLVVTLPANLLPGDHKVSVAVNNKFVIKTNAFHLIGWMVKRFAGTGADGYDNGAGLTNATFTNPSAMAVDRNNNMYVIDRNKIRKITPAGVVSDVAGNATSGFADGNALTTARFRMPSALAVDAAGNVYVADEGNEAIRMISTQGTVTTIAGMPGISGNVDGVATDARFNNPRGIVVNATGDHLYVSDWGNHKIRKINIATKQVTTYAGGMASNADGTGTNAGILFPGQLTLDADGTLYVCQSNSGRIVKVNTTTAQVTTYVQNLTDAPNRLAIDQDKNVYILNTGIGRITKYNANGQQVIINLAGSQIVNDSDGAATAVSFRGPAGLILTRDAANNPVFFIADTGNKKIKTLKVE